MNRILHIGSVPALISRCPLSVLCKIPAISFSPFSTSKNNSSTSASETPSSVNRKRSSKIPAPKPADGEPTNEPLAYFGSNAAAWTARQGQSGRSGGAGEEHVWFQPYVISGSLAVFMIYFCVLREENDIDHKLDRSLFDHVAGLEETQLQLSINYNKEHGLSTDALERRMAELEAKKGTDTKEG